MSVHASSQESLMVNDDVVGAFADGLRENNENSSLSTLDIDHATGPLTDNAWNQIGNLLCDPSSIVSTRFSNHVLHHLGYDMARMPRHVRMLLKTNGIKDKRFVARKKVIDTHFSGAETAIPLINNQTLLPALLSWAGRDALGCSIIYRTIQKKAPELLSNLN